MNIYFYVFVVFVSIIEINCSPPLQLKPLSGVASFEEDDFRQNPVSKVRLPSYVVPVHYDLEIRPILNASDSDPEQFTAPGTVSIRLSCITQTNNITLHSVETIIDQSNVKVLSYPDGIEIPVTGQTEDTNVSQITINLSSELVPGQEYILTIPFTALVGDRLSGLYRSSYVDASGNKRWLATTQFQKYGARMAFPCFDEPALRATFNITVGKANGYHTLSNSAISSTIPIPGLTGWTWDIYATTVNMPTYLVAIIVSDFVSVDAPAELSNYVVKTWGPPTITNAQTGEFSAYAAAKILTYFENYYNYSYQFPKLDSVAIPDFAAGAMENWALNTYRINLMIWFEGESTQFEQWRQSAVIAHEISHHWFGDLVTCEWWNDLWLNEGFARYTQFLGANATGKNFGVLDRYTLDVIQPAMDFDVTAASKPVRSNVTDGDVDTPSRIIYEKGGALIRMMQAFLTEETLIAGLRTYLKTHEYSNTVQDDLFTQLQIQTDADGTLTEFSVKEIMDTWTLQSGFPLIRLSRAGPNVIYTSQERFMIPSQRPLLQNENTLWFVPISYATKSNPDFSSANWQPKFWLDNFTLVTSRVVENSTDEWIIINPDARYYYRVLYDDHFFSLINAQLNEDHTAISLSTRSQLFDDYFKSNAAGYVNIKQALDLTRYLEKEDENTVWTTVLNNIRQPYGLLQDTNVTASFKNYLLEKVTGPLNRMGWNQETTDAPVTVILRSQLLDWACSLGSSNCTTSVNNLISAWLADPINNKVPADIQPAVFCSAIGAADANNIIIRQRILDEYQSATRSERQQLFINALSCETNSTALALLLEQTISTTSNINKETHGIPLLQNIAENSDNRRDVMVFLDSNKIGIISSLGESALSRVISTIASYTTDLAVATEINTLIEKFIVEGVSATVQQSLEASKAQLENNRVWINTHLQDIGEWLDVNSSP